MKVIEKMIASVSPSWALKRAEAKTRLALNNKMNSVFSGGGYAGAKQKSNQVNWRGSNNTANTELLPDLEMLRSRSHDLYRNAPAARGAIKTIASNVIGAGLLMRSIPDNDLLDLTPSEARDWADRAEELFQRWSDNPLNCDFTRKMTFSQIQRLVNSSQQLSGDVFVLMPWVKRPGSDFNLKLQLVDAARVCNPNDQPDTAIIAGGIEYDENQVPVAIHIRTPHPGDLLSYAAPTWERVEYYGVRTGRLNVLHIMEHEYIDQARGEPVLAPVIETLQQISKYSEAELSAAVINAMLAVFVKKPAEEVVTGAYDDDEVQTSNEIPELGTGTWIEGAPGEELQVVNAARPSNQFDPFFTATMKQVGMALEIPFEVLMKQFNSSYSASRAAILEAWKSWKVRRAWLVSTLCKPVYEEFITECVLTGKIDAPGYLESLEIKSAYLKTHWVGPTQGQLNPVVEVEAANKMVESGFTTRSMAAAELTGQDFEQIVKTQAQEKAMCAEYGVNFGSEVFQPGVVQQQQKTEVLDE